MSVESTVSSDEMNSSSLVGSAVDQSSGETYGFAAIMPPPRSRTQIASNSCIWQKSKNQVENLANVNISRAKRKFLLLLSLSLPKMS